MVLELTSHSHDFTSKWWPIILTLKTLRNGNNVSQKHNLEQKTLDNSIIYFAPFNTKVGLKEYISDF